MEERRSKAILPKHDAAKRATLVRFLKEINMAFEEFIKFL
jgi:hypothetical protein